MDIKLREIKSEAPVAEKMSLAPRAQRAKAEIKIEKVEVSKNIKSFERKVAKRSMGPYDYNVVAINNRTGYEPTAAQLISNPVYNTVGKFLGVDTQKEWGQYYDKVKVIKDWAEKKTGSKSLKTLISFIDGAMNASPSFGMSQKRIERVYLYAKLNET